jgi:hypothetical protein
MVISAMQVVLVRGRLLQQRGLTYNNTLQGGAFGCYR